MSEAATFRLAQLTDVHLGPIPPFWPRHWTPKRLAGFINYRKNRRHFDDRTRLNLLLEDLRAQAVDHTAVTGDLCNIGMPREFEVALDWLREVGPPDQVTVIPGNHDVYVPLVWDPGVNRWQDYMTGKALRHSEGTKQPALSFPFVRWFGKFALIGLNSAIVTPPGVPAGKVGAAQLDRFIEVSKQLHEAGVQRIVLIHHPPLPEHTTYRGLRDGHAFDAALTEAGAELVIHGHNHRDMVSWRDTRTGPVPVIGAACAAEGRYNIYDLEWSEATGCRITMTRRGVVEGDDRCTELQRMMIDPNPMMRQRII